MKKKDTLPKTPENLGYNPHILGYAQVANEYLNQGDERGLKLAQKSLEKICEKSNLPNWVSKSVQDPTIIHKTIENQLSDYNTYINSQTVNDLLKYNGKSLDKYIDGGSQRVQEELSEFVNMKYEDLKKEIAKTKYIIDGEKFDKSSKEEVEKAKEKYQKYQKVALTIGLTTQQDFYDFKREVEDNVNVGTMKDSFKELYPIREKAE